MHSQRILLSYSVYLIPWDTPANNPFKAKVFHIIKVESKSISYHAFSLSFSLSLFYDKEKECNQQHLVSIFRSGANCLEPLPDCLPSLALEYSSFSSYASVLSTTSTWGTSKGGENDTSKHVETICQFIPS
ncbi:hypothetical protein ACFXTO_006169 [Malus domestica]